MDQLTYHGHTYPLADWQTYTAYCQQHGLSLNALNMQITRGKIAPTDLLNVPEWGLKLIRANQPGTA